MHCSKNFNCMCLQISAVGRVRFLLLRKCHFSHYSPVTIFFFLVQQIHIWLAITLHPTSSRQKCLPLSAVGGHTYTKCVKGTIEFLEWVVFVSVRWAVRAEDRISTLPVILHVSHCQLRIQYVTIHKCFCHFRVWL